MKSSHVATAIALALGALAPAASAQPLYVSPIIVVRPPFFPVSNVCKHFDKRPCTAAELASPWYKQVVLFSAGFQDSERDAFFTEFDRAIDQMTGAAAGSVWSVQKRDQLLFVGYFTGGGSLTSPTASFGAHVAIHPIRGYLLSMRNDDVYAKIDAIRANNEIPNLRPFSAGVVFNTTQTGVTPSSSTPTFARRSFGIARFTVGSSPYVLTHELAHAGLNFLDEYTETGFQDMSVTSLDALSPFLQLDSTWGGYVNSIPNASEFFGIQLSEIIANNGSENVSTHRYPATVSTPAYGGDDFAYQGGALFGLGTWHMAGLNLMGANNFQRAANDGFAFAHSPAQQRVVDEAFAGGARRPNDRLVNAGPTSGWPLAFGSTTHVMMRDADKHHQFQPTRSYNVQVGWYDRVWHTCWNGPFPYPCYDDTWRTAQKTVSPTALSVDLKLSALYGTATLVQKVLCDVGVTDANTGSGKIQICDVDINTISNAFLPTVKFDIPYQDTDVPATQWLTTYYWRFSTNNGQIQSGYTGWSSFYRSL